MPAKVILNPYSNRWNAEKRRPEAEAALQAAGIDFELVVSPTRGGPVGLAEEAARAGYSPIIAAGGDGTVGDVVHGMALAADDEKAQIGPLGILPMGTANDLAWKVGIPLDLNDAARLVASGRSRSMDIGKVNERHFVNNCAVGIESYIGRLQEDITWISGTIRYMVAALKGIMDRPSWEGSIEWDGGSYQGPLSIVTVGNGSRSGAMFHMIPHADPYDGKLTFVYTYKKTRLAMLGTLVRILKPEEGNYVEMDDVHEHDFTWLKVRLESPSPVHTDGEITYESIQDLDYVIQPGRLRLYTPA
jgi:YegS/Rv2252/BmrU family lipid kinase